jgi:hypothetical protein
MSAPVQVGPSPSGGGPVPSKQKNLPTLEQLLILVARAERKGGLDYIEGRRLRDGILQLSEVRSDESEGRSDETDEAELRRKYLNARQRAWRWKRRATTQGVGPVGLADLQHAQPVDVRAEDSVRRVTELATRWIHIPAKRQAGLSVLAALSERQP